MIKEHICVQTGKTCVIPCYDGCTRHKDCGTYLDFSKESKLERDNRVYGNIIWWFVMVLLSLFLVVYFYIGDLC